MGSALVGMALHGGVVPVGGTFFVFADYMRPAIRLAALSKARSIFVFSHDSVGVGEDGPTHQPVEHLASLRSIPGLQVIRPADSNETARAWLAALTYDGPTALILSRQNLPLLTEGSAVDNGASEISRTGVNPVATLVGTGSEVSLCVEASKALLGLGVATRVVSMPSWDRFEAAPSAVQESVLPTGSLVVSVEAGTTFGWSRYASASVGIDRFGTSAPGAVAMSSLGLNVEHVVATVQKAIATNK
jgi:transketolase